MNGARIQIEKLAFRKNEYKIKYIITFSNNKIYKKTRFRILGPLSKQLMNTTIQHTYTVITLFALRARGIRLPTRSQTLGKRRIHGNPISVPDSSRPTRCCPCRLSTTFHFGPLILYPISTFKTMISHPKLF